MGGIFDWIGDTWNDLTGSSNSSSGTSYSYTPTATTTSDPFGFDLNFSSFTNPNSNPYLPAYNEFGYLGTTAQTATTTGASGGGFDLTSFLDGISGSVSALGSVFGTGLQAYADVQKLITSLAPQDKIVVRGGQTYIDRTVNGSTTTIPASTVYPQFTTQFATAQKSNQTQTLLLVGALGLGLVLILKKK
jgi:hypothetical protein